MHSSTERALWLVRCVLPHEPALRAWLQRKSVAGLEVDDIVQESYSHLSTLESVSHIRDPKTYLFQTAHSIIINHVRRSRVVPILAVDNLEAFEMACEQPGPETHVASHQELQRLANAIAKLPVRIRDVFVLRRVHDLPQREVARRLGLSENTVEKHMSKAFTLLASAFGDGGNPPSQTSRSSQRSTRVQRVSQRSASHDDSEGN